jgi:hypothetical protein
MDNQRQQGTSTQIRNLYSDGMSYLNIRFYNMNLSFSFQPFISKDATGRSTYDQNRFITTTVNWEGAFQLYELARDILDGKIQEGSVTIQCMSGVTLLLERKREPNGEFATYFVISKQNDSIPFKFSTGTKKIVENGQVVEKVIEAGLGVFLKTLNGYLEGINCDRHLDKVTEDYVKSIETKNDENTSFQTNSSYQNNNGGYKKPYNNYRKNYGNGYQQQNLWDTSNQQNMSTYNPQ